MEEILDVFDHHLLTGATPRLPAGSTPAVTATTHPNMTVLWLPDLGINGNSHMMAMDSNNGQVFEVIRDWIESHAIP